MQEADSPAQNNCIVAGIRQDSEPLLAGYVTAAGWRRCGSADGGRMAPVRISRRRQDGAGTKMSKPRRGLVCEVVG